MLSILFDNNDVNVFEKIQVATMEVKLPPIVAVTQPVPDLKLVHVAHVDHRVESKLQKLDPATATFIRGRQIQLIVDRYPVFQQLREGGRFEYSVECKALLATEETIARAVHHILHENHQIFKKNENQFVTKTPNRRTNGADDLNTIFKPLVKNWSEGQCEFHGRQWQFVLDSYGRRTSGVELAKNLGMTLLNWLNKFKVVFEMGFTRNANRIHCMTTINTDANAVVVKTVDSAMKISVDAKGQLATKRIVMKPFVEIVNEPAESKVWPLRGSPYKPAFSVNFLSIFCQLNFLTEKVSFRPFLSS